MKIEGMSNEVLRFKHTNDDLVFSTEDGVGIFVIEFYGRLKVMIDVGEDATHEKLKHAISLALPIRDRVMEWQGSLTADTQFFKDLARRKRGGYSYKQLAARLNRKIAGYLQDYAQFAKAYDAARIGFKTELDAFLWAYSPQQKYNPGSFDAAHRLLVTAGIKEKAAREMLNRGLENIAKGEPPFADEYPFTGEWLTEAAGNWRKNKKARKTRLVEGEPRTRGVSVETGPLSIVTPDPADGNLLYK